MKLVLMSVATAAALAAGLAAVPTAATAQQSDNPGEITVFGTDPCPRSTDDQVVICRRLPESMRYRMPEAYRPSGTKQQRESWANKVKTLSTAGASGIGSCSAVGPGGSTGCLIKEIEQARQQTQDAVEQSTAPEQ